MKCVGGFDWYPEPTGKCICGDNWIDADGNADNGCETYLPGVGHISMCDQGERSYVEVPSVPAAIRFPQRVVFPKM